MTAILLALGMAIVALGMAARARRSAARARGHLVLLAADIKSGRVYEQGYRAPRPGA